MPFIHDDFMLQTETARRLYHSYAEDQPIIDYHCHLPPKDIAENRRFSNLFEIWLEGDHYKWRAMRSNGEPEALCTGDADPYDKFLAWARTVPHTLRNPLYHWNHLELKRYFGIDDLISPKTAPAIWEQANEKLKSDDLSVHGILKNFDVRVIGTTDDPIDDLKWHQQIAGLGIETRVCPTFRPDKALTVDTPAVFNAWTDALAAAADRDIATYSDLLEALRQRHDFFHEVGCRLSDHGLPHCYADFVSDADASWIFDKARKGEPVTAEEKSQFASNIMLFIGQLNAEKGWTMQLHLGPLRNNNTRLFSQLGPDIGCDSIADYPQALALSRFLDRLDATDSLPKTILYNNNPNDNYAFATMIGNFQGDIPGKLQFGSGWWFLDQKEGMEMQINALSSLGLLSRFVGMLTDSRSFLSFPRHEYFRRILCNLIGTDIENGEIPDDDDLVGPMVENICYGNADAYFGF